MPINKKYLADFEAGKFYHVYNRTNNKELLFRNDDNCHYFLKRYHYYLHPYVDTYSWCLIPNHFHLLIKVKTEKEIKNTLIQYDKATLHQTECKYLNNEIDISILLEQSFKRFFQSYTLSFNKVFKRHGNLFYKPFKRVAIADERHLIQTIIYIHTNCTKHGVQKNFATYPWSSYSAMLSNAATHLQRTEVLNWFGNVAAFVKAHGNIEESNVYAYIEDE